ncbi:ATP-binding protein [Streptomyces sp. DSM 41982]|uniref:ATP-binding protein n=1 Tax=Streptomyces evansiae TaxID=3075535 RepID=A0ABD5E1E2_9ACTN|nr:MULTISPECIES: ATP-binding protein [unclassified Streptomyces]MDT0415233.1 ATP-binding protein [Streptomyces sp. DSM 41982]SCD42246.1 Predicted kinase [Streptomyces sp. SolWspMP-sol7th]
MALAVLLVGLTGSGKTTVARALAARGFVRLSVDEEVHRLHGRYGVDYPEDTYAARERPVVAALRTRFGAELRAGRDVVLDHGLWRRAERQSWRDTARGAGARAVMVCLPASREELLARLALRNPREDADALTVTPEALDDFLARFESPGADEDALVHDGDTARLVDTLAALREPPRG